MVFDKSSVKELYDNRDIIAQLFDLKCKIENMPNYEDVTNIVEMYKDFKSMMNDYIMYSDKATTITAQHTYTVIPRINADTTIDKIDGRQFVPKDLIINRINDEIKNLKNQCLLVNNGDQTVISKVEFKNITLPADYAKTNAKNEFIEIQTFKNKVFFRTDIDITGDSTITGNTTFDGRVVIRDGHLFEADSCNITQLYIGDKEPIVNRHELDVKGNAYITEKLTAKILECTDLTASNFKPDTLTANNLTANTKLIATNAEITTLNLKSELTAPSLKVTNKISSDDVETKKLKVTEEFKLNKLELNNIEVKGSVKASCIDVDQTFTASVFRPTSINTGQITATGLTIAEGSIIAENIYTSIEQKQEDEVINRTEHYIFDRQSANFKIRPKYTGDGKELVDNEFIVKSDVDKILKTDNINFNGKITFSTHPTITGEDETDDNSILTRDEIGRLIPFDLGDDKIFGSDTAIRFDQPVTKKNDNKWPTDPNELVCVSEVEGYISERISDDIIPGSSIIFEW